jgi:hypothetical protein
MRHSIQGGSFRSVPGNQVLVLTSLVVIVTGVLATLIFADVIQFASNDARVIMGTTLLFTAVLMVVYTLFLATRTECDFAN